jgi:hypothetical protein
VGTGSREENASKREAGADLGSRGRKLQNFSALSYSHTCVVRVFHALWFNRLHPAEAHDGPYAKAPRGRLASIDLPRARS